jgi:hypothetical protein
LLLFIHFAKLIGTITCPKGAMQRHSSGSRYLWFGILIRFSLRAVFDDLFYDFTYMLSYGHFHWSQWFLAVVPVGSVVFLDRQSFYPLLVGKNHFINGWFHEIYYVGSVISIGLLSVFIGLEILYWSESLNYSSRLYYSNGLLSATMWKFLYWRFIDTSWTIHKVYFSFDHSSWYYL